MARHHTKEQRRRHNLKYNHGLSTEDYDNFFTTQGGKCAICHVMSNGHKSFCVDHDHISGRIRGLLCTFCNLGLGNFKDNPVYLQNAIKYLAC